MADGDDEEVLGDDEDRELGAEGEAAVGEDESGRDDESEVSAQQPDAEADEGAPPSRGPAKPEAQSRGSTRFQRLANENREYRDRLDRLEREREQERRQYLQQQQQLTEQQERERLALMTPEERADYRITQHERRTAEVLRQTQINTAVHMDKAAYEAKAVNNPVYRRMQEAVEARFAEQMRIGQPTDRETILKYLLGEQAINGAASGGGAARRQARRRVEQQAVKPSAGKSSATTSRKVSTAEERLKDVLI